MATTQHRPHGAFAGPLFGTLEGKTEDTGPTANPITQHRPHGAFAGRLYGTLSGKGASAAATISAAYGTPTGGTTATVGCTTDTASGTLWALVRIGGSPAADTAIEAGGQTAAVSTTTPSIAYTGLTAATGYSVDIVQKVSGVYSNVITATFTTDNTGSGGGSEASEAALAATGGSGTFSGSVSSPAVAAMAATGGAGTFSGAAGFNGASMDATGGSGTFSGAAYIEGSAAMAATGGSGTFAGSAVGASASTGAGIKKRKQAGMKAAPLPMMAPPQQMDMAEVSMILAALFEVGVFDGVAD